MGRAWPNQKFFFFLVLFYNKYCLASFLHQGVHLSGEV